MEYRGNLTLKAFISQEQNLGLPPASLTMNYQLRVGLRARELGLGGGGREL